MLQQPLINLRQQYIRKAALVLSICALFLFYKYIAQLYPSVISVSLLNDFKLTGVQLAIMATSYYYTYSICQIFAGYLIDRYDTRIPSFLAILLISGAIIAFAKTDNFTIMCITRALMGIGASVATVLYMKCAAVWTSERLFGIVSSLAGTVTMLGAAFGSAPVALFFAQTGWSHGLLIIGIAGICISFLALAFISNKTSVQTQRTQVTTKDLLNVVTQANNWLLFVYAGSTFAPLIILGGLWGNPFLIEKFHIDNSSASTLMSTMFIGMAVGAPFWATLSNILGRQHANNKKWLMHFANLLSFITLAIIIYVNTSYASALALFFILGFGVGCFMCCFQLCRDINSIALMGFASAFMNMSDGIFSSIIEPIVGYILDASKSANTAVGQFSIHSYQIALSTLLLCYVISSISLHFIRKKKA